MLTTQTKIVLSKLIELTSERDVNSLEIVLAKALFDLAASNSVVIYRVVDFEKLKFSARLIGESGVEESIPEGLNAELVECLISGNHRIYKQDDYNCYSLYPLMSHKSGPLAVITVHTDGHDENMHVVTTMLLKIYQNFITLLNDNERDTLTGLLNRKTFELKISKVMMQLQNNQQRASDKTSNRYYLAIFDIDHFKRVNDQYGHLLGDEVLLLFSRLLFNSFRDKDMIFRFGGEEFVAVFDCADSEQMHMVLDRFREKVQAYPFPQIGKVSISVGFTEIQPFDDFSKIIDRADTALYFSKNNGRNQVRHFESLVDAGDIEHNKIEGEVEFF